MHPVPLDAGERAVRAGPAAVHSARRASAARRPQATTDRHLPVCERPMTPCVRPEALLALAVVSPGSGNLKLICRCTVQSLCACLCQCALQVGWGGATPEVAPPNLQSIQAKPHTTQKNCHIWPTSPTILLLENRPPVRRMLLWLRQFVQAALRSDTGAVETAHALYQWFCVIETCDDL